jgi:hypothetical protein
MMKNHVDIGTRLVGLRKIIADHVLNVREMLLGSKLLNLN